VGAIDRRRPEGKCSAFSETRPKLLKHPVKRGGRLLKESKGKRRGKAKEDGFDQGQGTGKRGK